MKRILITGGTGFVGSHTCISLIENGYEVLILDSLRNSSKIVLKKIEEVMFIKKIDVKNKLFFFEGDIRDRKLINKIFEKSLDDKKPIQAVIHLAGLKAVRESVKDPFKYWDVNVGGSLNLFSTMLKFGCLNIIFSSSASIYNSNTDCLLKEESNLLPVHPYGRTKETIEKILFDIYQSSEYESMNIINLRYFNPVGAHPSGLIGEDPKCSENNNLFPVITQVASGRRKILNIFGNNWPTCDGTTIRDYVHIMDLAKAHQLALDFAIKNKKVFMNLNIGTGIGTSVFEFIKKFEKVNNYKIPYKILPRREGDVAKLVADASKAKKILNWQPQYSLEDVCRDGWKWLKCNPKGFQN